MTMELITGKAGTLHVDSGDIGAYNAYTMGTGCYVLSGCECTMTNSNTLHITPGELLVEGRLIRITGQGEDVVIDNGTQAQNRNDLACVHYMRNASNGNTESSPIAVLKGTPTSGTPTDPTYARKSILGGDADVYHPFCRVPLKGIAVGAPIRLFEKFTPAKDAWDSVSPIPGRVTALEKLPPRVTALEVLPPRVAALEKLPPRVAALEGLPPRVAALETKLYQGVYKLLWAGSLTAGGTITVPGIEAYTLFQAVYANGCYLLGSRDAPGNGAITMSGGQDFGSPPIGHGSGATSLGYFRVSGNRLTLAGASRYWLHDGYSEIAVVTQLRGIL